MKTDTIINLLQVLFNSPYVPQTGLRRQRFPCNEEQEHFLGSLFLTAYLILSARVYFLGATLSNHFWKFHLVWFIAVSVVSICKDYVHVTAPVIPMLIS